MYINNRGPNLNVKPCEVFVCVCVCVLFERELVFLVGFRYSALFGFQNPDSDHFWVGFSFRPSRRCVRGWGFEA